MADNNLFPSLSFKDIIVNYNNMQQKLVKQVKALASNSGSATPGKFLLLQFGMSQLTQVGDSISNLISQVNTCINMAVRNQKTQ